MRRGKKWVSRVHSQDPPRASETPRNASGSPSEEPSVDDPSQAEEGDAGYSEKSWEKSEQWNRGEDPWSKSDPWQRQESYQSWHRGWQWHDSIGWYKPWEDQRETWRDGRQNMAKIEETTLAANGRWHGAVPRQNESSTMSSAHDESTGDARGRPTEKMQVPEFSADGGDGEVGQSARSYVRKVQAWLKCTRMSDREKGLALYTNLKGKAWIAAEELSVERLYDVDGAAYLLDWVRVRFMEIEVTKVANVMNELFRRCKKRSEQTVREFNLEFERLLMHLQELDCELPQLVKAWLYVDKLRLSESEEMSLLSSVHNKYDMKLLQQAALLHDRGTRRPGGQGGWDRGEKRWNRQSTVHMTNLDEDSDGYGEPAQAGDAEEMSDDDLVTEDVAAGFHDAFMAYQDAKSRYREAVKGRGFDREELKKRSEDRLRAAKARSFCSVCKRKGHWHRDPECPLRGKATTAAPSSSSRQDTSTTKSVQLCQVYMTQSESGQDGGPGGRLEAIADTACSRTVAGHDWFEKYSEFAEKHGFPVEIEEACEKFRFGASRIHESTFSIWARFAVRDRAFAVKVAIVACKVPLLLSRNVLSKLGMVYQVDIGVADLSRLGVTSLMLGSSETGHPTIPVDEFDKAVETARAPIESSRWAPDPEIRLHAVAEAYMGAVDQTTPPPLINLFYPKKVNEEIRKMLCHSPLSKIGFYQWWRRAPQSRDFWIETCDELIRIHVVPRVAPFDPRLWKTSQQALKDKLVDSLGSRRVTEVVPCSSAEVFLYEHVDEGWHDLHGSEQADSQMHVKKHGIWIGRSRFSRKPMLSSPSVDPSADVHVTCAGLTMEDEQGRDIARAAESGGDRASTLDGPGVAEHAGGTTRGADAKETEECGIEGDLPDDPEGADREGTGEQPHLAAKADERGGHETPERPSSARRGSSGDLREVQELPVQRDTHQVLDLGDRGDQRQSQFECRTGTAGKLGEERAEETREDPAIRGASSHSSPGSRSSGEDPSARPGRHDVGFHGILGLPPEERLLQAEGKAQGNHVQEEQLSGHRGEGGHGKRAAGRSASADFGLGDTDCHSEAEAPGASITGAIRGISKQVINLGKKVRDGIIGRESTSTPPEDQRGREEAWQVLDGLENEEEDNYDVEEQGGVLGEPQCSDRDIPQNYDMGSAAKEASRGHEEKETTPRQRAIDGIRRRKKLNESKRKKLYGMTKQLCTVLATCLVSVGCLAEEVFCEPLHDLWEVFGLGIEERPSCLELFAGSCTITDAFAKKRHGVLRPRDLVFGDDLRSPRAREEILEAIDQHRPWLVWAAPPCTAWSFPGSTIPHRREGGCGRRRNLSWSSLMR